jgi:hypothetical protein
VYGWEHKETKGIMWNTDMHRRWEISTYTNSNTNLNNNLVIISARKLHLQQANCTIRGVLSHVNLFETMWDLRFSQQWQFWLCSFGLNRHVNWLVEANVSKKYVVSIFRAEVTSQDWQDAPPPHAHTHRCVYIYMGF